jgi:hypothetical protein
MNDSPKHDELPLPDYDHIPTGTLPTRIQGLDSEGVQQLLAYEKAHANRLGVIQILENRLNNLQDGASPSGPPVPTMPEKSDTQGGSPVSPATAGPPVNPPHEGVPTNPSQPR